MYIVTHRVAIYTYHHCLPVAMTTRSCFSSSLPCTKLPTWSAFMLAFGWKVLSTPDIYLPRQPLLCFVLPIVVVEHPHCLSVVDLGYYKCLLSNRSTLVTLVCVVLQNRVFLSSYIYAKSFFFTWRRVLVIWRHFPRRREKKQSPKSALGTHQKLVKWS